MGWLRRLFGIKHPDQKALEKAIANYPIYAPPHAQPYPRKSLTVAQENYEYFLADRPPQRVPDLM